MSLPLAPMISLVSLLQGDPDIDPPWFSFGHCIELQGWPLDAEASFLHMLCHRVMAPPLLPLKLCVE